MTRTRLTRALLFVLTVGLVTAVARPASAQVFVSPLIGYNFGGDSGCQSITNCEDKNLNVGITLGNYGTLFGIEEEFAFAKDFFGDVGTEKSSVATLMTSLLIAPDIARVKPYALLGVGLIKSNVEFGKFGGLNKDLNTVAWQTGGGIVYQFSDRLGVRGDVRFIKSMKDFSVFGRQATGNKLEFARFGVGFMIFF